MRFSAVNLGQMVEVIDAHALDRGADPLGIDVEGGHDAKALVIESLVAQQGSAQVAGADHGHRPIAIGAQDFANGVDQVVAAIANAGMAEVPEIGQVLANLGVAEAEQPS